MGDAGTGKSALITRFLENEFKKKYEPTVGVDFKSETLFLGGRVTKLQILDTSGASKFRSLLPQYARSADVVVVCFDVTNRNSFASAPGWFSLTMDAKDVEMVHGAKQKQAKKRQMVSDVILEGL